MNPQFPVAQDESEDPSGLAELERIQQEEQDLAAVSAASEIALVNQGIQATQSIVIAIINVWHTHKRQVVWPESTLPVTSRDSVLASLVLLANISNSQLAVRRLASSGFTREARTVFRQMTEVADVSLLYLADAEFAEFYLASPEDWKPAYAHWKKGLGPSRVREKLDEIEAALEGVERSSTTKERWDLYAWLSKSAHVDYASLSIEGLAADVQGVHNLNLGGRFGPLAIATLKHLASYQQFFLGFLTRLLIERHSWNASDADLGPPLAHVAAFMGEYMKWNLEREGV